MIIRVNKHFPLTLAHDHSLTMPVYTYIYSTMHLHLNHQRCLADILYVMIAHYRYVYIHRTLAHKRAAPAPLRNLFCIDINLYVLIVPI